MTILLAVTPAVLAYLIAKKGRDADGAGRVSYEFGSGACWMLEYIIIQHLVMTQLALTGIGLAMTAALTAGLGLIVTHVIIRLIREDE